MHAAFYVEELGVNNNDVVILTATLKVAAAFALTDTSSHDLSHTTAFSVYELLLMTFDESKRVWVGH